MHGVLNLLKPPGMSSHDAVAAVRRSLGEKRVGHTGTLDPAAAGVLPICVGQATRLVEYLQAGTKEYRAEIVFGQTTDSGDLLGTVVEQMDTASLKEGQITAVLPQFVGQVTQVPPLHSAIKVDGKRLYEVAREGGTASIPTRQVHITSLQLLGFAPASPGHPARALIHVVCSGGTYIRSLVRDLALAAGSLGTMSFLVRTRSGSFQVQDAVPVEQIKARHLKSLPAMLGEQSAWCLVSDELSLKFFQGRTISDIELRLAGLRVAASHGSTGQGLVHNSAQTLFALIAANAEGGDFAPVKVFDLRV